MKNIKNKLLIYNHDARQKQKQKNKNSNTKLHFFFWFLNTNYLIKI